MFWGTSSGVVRTYQGRSHELVRWIVGILSTLRHLGNGKPVAVGSGDLLECYGLCSSLIATHCE